MDNYPNVLEVESELATSPGSFPRMNDEYILDLEITLDEVEVAVSALKSGNEGGGADGLDPEHLKRGGLTFLSWLL